MPTESFSAADHRIVCMRKILGIHHVTAIAGDPQKNLDFYAGILNLRLVKLTVNYDDPGTYHLYYGDYSGSPGTILTFFPWRGVPEGRAGAGQVTTTSFSVGKGSLDGWRKRLASQGVEVSEPQRRFAEEFLTLRDFDGMELELVASHDGGPEIRGFHNATISVARLANSARLLTETMGFQQTAVSGTRHRFELANGGPHSIVDLVETPSSQRALQGAGSIHHIAWRVPDDAAQQEWRSELVSRGLGVSPVMDRKYFHSIYYREPSGILYEIATDSPGFALDEPLESLGSKLVLPPWLEPSRAELEASLPRLVLPELQHA